MRGVRCQTGRKEEGHVRPRHLRKRIEVMILISFLTFVWFGCVLAKAKNVFKY